MLVVDVVGPVATLAVSPWRLGRSLTMLSLLVVISRPRPRPRPIAASGEGTFGEEGTLTWDVLLLACSWCLVVGKGELSRAGVPATLVSAAEYRECPLSRLKVELLMLTWVLSVEDGSRLRVGIPDWGVPDRMGVTGLTGWGRREPEFRERRGKPGDSGVGLLLTGRRDGPGEFGEGRGMETLRMGPGAGQVGTLLAEAAGWER